MNLNIADIKGIIFDYGGTIDTGGDHWSEVIWDAYNKAQVAVDKASFREAYVYGERELAKTLHILPHHNFNDMLLIKIKIELQWLSENGKFPPALVDSKGEEVAKLCYESARKSVGDAAGVLERLSKHYKLVLVSNFYGNIETVLKDFGIRQYFAGIIESAVVGVRKPDPEIFKLGVKELGIEPSQTLVVGDSYTKDILPAEKAGCQVIWIKGKGWTEEEDARTHPNTIADLQELLTLFGV